MSKAWVHRCRNACFDIYGYGIVRVSLPFCASNIRKLYYRPSGLFYRISCKFTCINPSFGYRFFGIAASLHWPTPSGCSFIGIGRQISSADDNSFRCTTNVVSSWSCIIRIGDDRTSPEIWFVRTCRRRSCWPYSSRDRSSRRTCLICNRCGFNAFSSCPGIAFIPLTTCSSCCTPRDNCMAYA